MKILVDTHVHTVSSGHAYSTIDEIARFAKSKNLEAIAMTDHTHGMPGGAHPFHFGNMRILPKYMHGVRIIKGAEVNIMDYDGNIDMDPRMAAKMEIVIASLHPPCIKGASKEIITKTLMRTIENPNVDIIGHPGDDRYPIDFKRLVKHAKEHHVLLELNNSSLKSTGARKGARKHIVEMLKWCMKYETSIAVATDAHYHEYVGVFTKARELLKEVNFPQHLVANTNTKRLMTFINKGAI